MATPWQLVISSLDGSQATREATVEADNWLAALRAARKQLGEEGGVPAGASCVMSAVGDVTIVDATTQLRYELRKRTGQSAAPSKPAGPAPSPAKPAGPTARKARSATVAYSAEEAAKIRQGLPGVQPAPPQPSQAARPPAAAAHPAPTRAQPNAAPPSQAQPAPAATAPKPGQPPASSRPEAPAAQPPSAKKQRQQTVAYLHNPFGPAPAAPGPQQSQPTPTPQAAKPQAPQPQAPQPQAAQPSPPKGGSPPKKRQMTVAYMQNPLAQPSGSTGGGPPGEHPPAGAPAKPPGPQTTPQHSTSSTDPAAGAKKPRPRTVAYMQNPLDAPKPAPASPPPPAPSASQPPPPAKASQPPPAQPGSQAPAPTPAASAPSAQAAGPKLLHVRDEEPTAERPLTYRERAFAVDPQTDDIGCEWLLREQLAKIREELRDRPTGKFVSIALFDHAWSGRPSRPPLATLQWKDWRGEPEIELANSPSDQSWRAPSGIPPASSMPPTEAAPPGPPTVQGPQAPSPAAQPPSPAASQGPPPQARAPQAAPAPAVPTQQAPQAPAPPAPPASQAPPPPAAQQPPAAPAPAPTDPAQSWPRSSAPSGTSRPASQTGEQDRRLAYAFEAAQDLYFLETPGEGMGFAARLLQELIPCEAALGALYDINTDELRILAATGAGAQSRHAQAIPAKKGLFSIAIAAGMTVWVSADLQADPRFKPDTDAPPDVDPRNAAYIVVRHGDTLLGIVQLVNRTDPRGFTDADKSVAAYVADQLRGFLQERRALVGR